MKSKSRSLVSTRSHDVVYLCHCFVKNLKLIHLPYFVQITMNSEEDLPPEVTEEAQKVVLDLLPTKSREIYECAYKRFIKWCEEKDIKTYSENALLVYFADLAKK